FAGLEHMQNMISCVRIKISTAFVFIKTIIMATLKYKVITSQRQYYLYCKTLESLVFVTHKTKDEKDEIALLTLLIENWDSKHNILGEVDPVRLLKSLMDDHKMKAKDLVELLGVSKGYISDI